MWIRSLLISDYATINLSNLRPMFTQEQISASLLETEMITPVLRVTIIMDIEQLNSDILYAHLDVPQYKSNLAEPTLHWFAPHSPLQA